jgi:nanoRNase/pAp phosphatase (c-di-AMP/oligoRNAs hydrolase)
MRLITRSDFDGLACSALLESCGIVDDWFFIHPKDVQDGNITATQNDVVVNVPYIKNCKLWFDHHSSESERLGDFAFEGAVKAAPSCARVIYDYYGGEKKFPDFSEMIQYIDKMDSGNLSLDEVLHPTGWVLLGFIADPRTGLGRMRNFTISNFDLMKQLSSKTFSLGIDEILKLPDVKERIDVYFEHQDKCIEMIKRNAKIFGNVISVDLRGMRDIPCGNRFLLYTVFPEQNVSIMTIDGKQKQNVAITVGYNIINKTSKADIGSIMLKFGGGGHKQVGTCQVPYSSADDTISKIITLLRS